MVKTGAQQTSIKSTCGFTTFGNPREARAKLKIHIRHCELCKNTNHIVPKYNNSSNSAYKGMAASKRGNPIVKQPTTKIYNADTGESRNVSFHDFNNL